jgi:hypothetical protein
MSKCRHMGIWTCGQVDMWTYGHVVGEFCRYMFCLFYTFCHYRFCPFIPFVVVRFVPLYLMSFYTFCDYTFCLFLPFFIIRFVVIRFVFSYLLLLYVLSLYTVCLFIPFAVIHYVLSMFCHYTFRHRTQSSYPQPPPPHVSGTGNCSHSNQSSFTILSTTGAFLRHTYSFYIQ